MNDLYLIYRTIKLKCNIVKGPYIISDLGLGLENVESYVYMYVGKLPHIQSQVS